MDKLLAKGKDLISFEDDNGWRWYGTSETPYLYPSVTTILKETVHQPGLINWFKYSNARDIDKKLAETGRIGTELHELFDSILKGNRAMLKREYQPHAAAFSKWVNDVQAEPYLTEFTVFSDRYGFAGKIDFYGRVNGRNTVVDWKTGTNFGDTWGDQVAAYQLAVCEMADLPSDDVDFMILQINRESAELKSFKYVHKDWMQNSFLLALERFKRVPRFTKLQKLKWPYLMKKGMVRA